MKYLIKMIPPDGPAEYIPDGFGFHAHEHVLDIGSAKTWSTEKHAWFAWSCYTNPPSFWQGERKHAKLMQNQFRGWKAELVTLED